MARVLAVILVLAACVAAEANAAPVDLDKPGALEALERDRPAHYRKVMEEISTAQTIHVDPEPSVQRADTGTADPRQKGATTLLTTDPAKKRLTILLDDMEYRVTAHMTHRPGKVEKAR